VKAKKLRGDRGGEIAKLFARHIKLEEHTNYLKRTKVGAAIGTSGRLGKLLEIGMLNYSMVIYELLHIFQMHCPYLHSRTLSWTYHTVMRRSVRY
jgi:protein CMS1